MATEEHERICFNCESFFLASATEATEFGICLKDEAFDPYIEELLVKSNFACCQDLIDKKKLSGEREACGDFRDGVLEGFEIDDDSVLGRALKRLIDEGPFDMKQLESAIIEEELESIDWKTAPVENSAGDLRDPSREKRDSAVSQLGFLISQGNKSAFRELLDFFIELPPAKTLDEVHSKMDLLRRLDVSHFRGALTPALIQELYRTESNNTTRQLISAIFRFLDSCPLDEVRAPLEEMLKDKRFSYRLKRKIRDILETPQWGGPFSLGAGK